LDVMSDRVHCTIFGGECLFNSDHIIWLTASMSSVLADGRSRWQSNVPFDSTTFIFCWG
jgi:hypothetical protein